MGFFEPIGDSTGPGSSQLHFNGTLPIESSTVFHQG